MSEPQKDEKLIKDYCRHLLADPIYTSLEVLGMRDEIALEETSFRLRLIEPNYQAAHSRLSAPNFNDAEWENWVSDATKAATAEASTATPGKSRPLNPFQALAVGRRLAVIGEQGSGKTTLLRWLALHAARSDTADLPDLPVLISLSEYSHAGNGNLAAFIARRLGVNLASIEERLQNGQLLLLCDGLDEAGRNRQAGQEQLYRNLEDFAAAYPQVMLVVACRRAGLRRNLRGFYVAEICDLGWEDVQDFIRKWFTRSPQVGRELSAKLLQNFGLRSMAASPLLLSLICTIYEREGSLPHRRVELYSQCIMLLRPRSDNTDSLRRLTLNQEVNLLGQLALYLHKNYRRELTRQEALEILRQSMPQFKLGPEAAEEILQKLTTGQGLLRYQTEEVLGFAHLSLQEFFAADAVAKGELAGIESYLFEDWWREVILLLAGMGDATPLLNLIWSKRKLGNPAILLACRCLGEEPHLLDTTFSMAIMTATMQLILEGGGDYALKGQAIEALASVKRKETVGYLAALLPRSDVGRYLDWDLYGRVLETLVQLNDRFAIKIAFVSLRRAELDNAQKLRLIDALATSGDWEQVLADLKLVLPSLQGDAYAKTLLLLTQNNDLSIVGKALRVLNLPDVDDNLKARLLPNIANALEGDGPPDPILTGHIYKLLQDGPRSSMTLRLKLCDFAIQRGGAPRLLELIRIRPRQFELELQRRIVVAAMRFGQASEILPRLLLLLDETDGQEFKRQVMAAIVAVTTSELVDSLLNHLRVSNYVDDYNRTIALLAEELQPDSKKVRAVTQRYLSRPEETSLTRSGTNPLGARCGTTSSFRSGETGPLRRLLEGYRTLATEINHYSYSATVSDDRNDYQYIYNHNLINSIANGAR